MTYPSKVALVKGERSVDTVLKAIRLAGEAEFRDRSIVIKVN